MLRLDWLTQSPDAATIAIVDSGIDATRTADFGNRILGQVNLTSLSPNSPGDGYGHGTFVASIAAGAAPGYAGAAPKAELLSLDVMNDQGQATVADVIKAADYILANKAQVQHQGRELLTACGEQGERHVRPARRRQSRSCG